MFPLSFRLQNSVRLLSYAKPILRKKPTVLLSFRIIQVFLAVPECSLCWVLFQTDSSRLVSQSRTQSLLLAWIYLQREGKRMVHGMVIPPVCLHKLFPVSRLQNSPYFCTFKYERTSQTKGLERGWKQRARLGKDAQMPWRVRLARFARVRLKRLFLFYAKPILRKNRLFCSLPC